jgi:L-lactate dehydrogenase complex protein LldG
MSSRDLVLGRLRSALQGAPAPAAVPREYRQVVDVPDLVGLLEDRLIDYKAVVHRASDVAAAVATILGDGKSVVVPPGIDSAWLPDDVIALYDHGLDMDSLSAADGVLTAATVAVAETGTIVLDASPDQGRRIITLLPDLHICVLRPAQVVASVPEAVARLTPGRPLTWISGPSATSDIELNRVEGVHGPRRLHVILLEE